MTVAETFYCWFRSAAVFLNTEPLVIVRARCSSFHLSDHKTKWTQTFRTKYNFAVEYSKETNGNENNSV